MQRLITIICLMATGLAAAALELPFSYAHDGATGYFGYGKAETYDVAIFIPGHGLEGKTITGLRVAVPAAAELTDPEGWLSSELTTKRVNGKYINQPDICIAKATVADGWLSAIFETPYQLTADGIYAGYSFTLQENTTDAVATSPSQGEGSFWIHATRSKIKWGSLAEETGLSSSMEVYISGDFAENAAVAAVEGMPLVAIDEDAIVKARVMNCGTGPISSLGYSYSTSATEGKGEIVLDTPIAAYLGASAEVELNLGIMPATGITPVDITIDHVDGKINGIENPRYSFEVKVLPFMPVCRPLFEEYTALWCSWCPRGYVAMEAMKEWHGDKFVGIAYHSGDSMDFGTGTPNSSGGGLPTAYVNRSHQIGPETILTTWDNYRNSVPAADVDVTLEWTDGPGSDLTATSETRFVESADNTLYSIGYVLVADGMTDPLWLQSNNYTGMSIEDYPYMVSPWGEIFFEGGSYVKGLVFSDVAVAASDFDGIRGAIPQDIEADTPYTHQFTFASDKIGKAMQNMEDVGKFRVIAVLRDAGSGKFVNCNSSIYADGTGAVNTHHASSDTPVQTEWYDMMGHRVGDSFKGIAIRIDRFADGSSRTVKTCRK